MYMYSWRNFFSLLNYMRHLQARGNVGTLAVIQCLDPVFSMDDDLADITYLSEMSRTGSCGCLSKQNISNSYECILSCTTYPSLIYILLLVISLLVPFKLDLIFHIIGYISLFSLITTPLGLYGSSRGSYCALFTFFILASYHLYALVMYFWFDIKAPMFRDRESTEVTCTKDFEYLHYILSGSYTILIALSILFVTCKITSLVNQIDPARVIVVDNNPVD